MADTGQRKEFYLNGHSWDGMNRKQSNTGYTQNKKIKKNKYQAVHTDGKREPNKLTTTTIRDK